VQKKRIFNLRKPFLCFVGFVVGIILSYNFFVSNVLREFPIVSVVTLSLLLLVFIILTLCFVYYKRTGKYVIGFISRLVSNYIFILIFVISILIGVGVSAIPLTKISGGLDVNKSGVIEAEVQSITEYEYGCNIVLDNVVVVTDDKMVSLDGKASVYITNSPLLMVGDVISFDGIISSNNITDSDDIDRFVNNVGYTIKYSNNLQIIENSNSIRGFILNNILSILRNNMSQNNALLSYGMLFGDKSAIPEEVTEAFSTSGVLHLLAVSGLHVGIISAGVFAVINLVMKKIKLKRKTKQIISISLLSIFLLFYAWLCYFSVSVCRASIMIIVYLLARGFGKKYDALNSLSIAGLIILLISPLSIFSLGFQLSFLCIFAIITLVPVLTNSLVRLHIPKSISATFVTSVCINILILPVLINAFGEASFVTIISNILVIPMFSFIFPLLFFITILVALLPFMGFALAVPDILLQVLKFVIDLFASIPLGVVRSLEISYFVLGGILLLSFVIKYFMSRPAVRGLVVSIIFVMTLVAGITSSMPNVYSNTLLMKYKYQDLYTIFVIDGKVVSFGLPDKYSISFTRDMRISNVDVLVISDYDFNRKSDLVEFVERYGVEEIYYSATMVGYDTALELDGVNSYFVEDYNIGKVNVKYLKNYVGKYLGKSFVCDDYSVMILDGVLKGADYSFIGSEYPGLYDYVVLDSDVDLNAYNITARKVIRYEDVVDNSDIVLNNLSYCDITLGG